MAIISRGFAGRRSAAEVKLPPGQYLTTDFHVAASDPSERPSTSRHPTSRTRRHYDNWCFEEALVKIV
jgi:hypothetical protein